MENTNVNQDPRLSIESPMMNQHTLYDHAMKLEQMIIRLAEKIGHDLKKDMFSIESALSEKLPELEAPKAADLFPPLPPVENPPTDLRIESVVETKVGDNVTFATDAGPAATPVQTEPASDTSGTSH